MRGRVDLEIHTRRRTLEQAADLLSDSGMDHAQARAMVRRYILKPGYQLAYTIGRRKFKNLFDEFKHKGKGAPAFARLVHAQGEIAFDALAHILTQGG